MGILSGIFWYDCLLMGGCRETMSQDLSIMDDMNLDIRSQVTCLLGCEQVGEDVVEMVDER